MSFALDTGTDVDLVSVVCCTVGRASWIDHMTVFHLVFIYLFFHLFLKFVILLLAQPMQVVVIVKVQEVVESVYFGTVVLLIARIVVPHVM